MKLCSNYALGVNQIEFGNPPIHGGHSALAGKSFCWKCPLQTLKLGHGLKYKLVCAIEQMRREYFQQKILEHSSFI